MPGVTYKPKVTYVSAVTYVSKVTYVQGGTYITKGARNDIHIKSNKCAKSAFCARSDSDSYSDIYSSSNICEKVTLFQEWHLCHEHWNSWSQPGKWQDQVREAILQTESASFRTLFNIGVGSRTNSKLVEEIFITSAPRPIKSRIRNVCVYVECPLLLQFFPNVFFLRSLN